MNKTYIAPATVVINVKMENALLMTSGTGEITTTESGLEINSYGSSSTGNAAARGGSIWDDDEDDY